MSKAPAIEKLTDYFVAEDGTAFYQVKWKKTWERADSLASFNELIEQFWKFVNDSNSANVCSNKVALPKPKPVLPEPPPPVIKQEPNIATTPKQPVKRRTSNPSTPKTPKTPKTPASSKKQPGTPKRLLTQDNVPNSHAFLQNNMPFGNHMNPMAQQMSPQLSPLAMQRNISKSAVVIDSDDDDDVTMSNFNMPQQSNQFQMNSPNQAIAAQMNNQAQGNTMIQNNKTPNKQVLPNGLNMFHPANRLLQTGASPNNIQQRPVPVSIKEEPSNDIIMSPTQIKQQPQVMQMNSPTSLGFQPQFGVPNTTSSMLNTTMPMQPGANARVQQMQQQYGIKMENPMHELWRYSQQQQQPQQQQQQQQP